MIFGKQSSGRGEASAGTPELVRVHMLGGFSVSVGSRPVGEGSWRLKKAASLVKLLALTEEHRLHLMDIKRIAFETQPIEGVTPAPTKATWEPEMAA